MPATSTVTITADQREAIYSYVHDRLSALGDVWKSIEREDYATAERTGSEFRQDFHLLDALGWQPRDERDGFSLTLPVDDLASLPSAYARTRSAPSPKRPSSARRLKPKSGSRRAAT